MSVDKKNDLFDDFDIDDDIFEDKSKEEESESEDIVKDLSELSEQEEMVEDTYLENDEVEKVIEEDKVVKENTSEKKRKKEKEKVKQKEKNKNAKGKKDEDTKVTEKNEISKTILYILTDNEHYGMLEFVRKCGLNVTTIFTNVSELVNTMIMQFDPVRVAVIDSGTGKFITPTIRSQIIDMIGMDSDSIKISVFFTDSLLKSNAVDELGKGVTKSVEWIPYKSTTICVASLLQHREEEYVIDKATEYNNEVESVDLLKHKCDPVPNCRTEKLTQLTIIPSTIYKSVVEDATEDDCLYKFPIKIKA